MIAIRLDVLLQLRRHWRAIDALLCNEIERMKEQEEKAHTEVEKLAKQMNGGYLHSDSLKSR